MIRQIKEEEKRLEIIQAKMRKELSKLAKGKLKVSTCHNTYQYYVDDKYISKKKMKLLEDLALREYYEKLDKAIDQSLSKYKRIRRELEAANLEQVYKKIPEGKRKLIKTGCYLTVEQKIEQFEKEAYKEEELAYEISSDIYTVKGEHVRSKSEKIIADELCRRGIPYRYEKPLVLSDRGRKIILHPDFTIMNKRTGKIYILEHLGLMDNIDYAQNAMKKISLYEKNGFLLGKNLLLLHETTQEALNVKILEMYIEEYLM